MTVNLLATACREAEIYLAKNSEMPILAGKIGRGEKQEIWMGRNKLWLWTGNIKELSTTQAKNRGIKHVSY